jgi:hypothetical protein
VIDPGFIRWLVDLWRIWWSRPGNPRDQQQKKWLRYAIRSRTKIAGGGRWNAIAASTLRCALEHVKNAEAVKTAR